ncbi:unnamed protein product, partial [Meganyctiphanes norvegica]
IGEVAVGVLGAVYQVRAVEEVSSSLTSRVQEQYAVPGYEDFTTAIDYVQYQLQCCGVSSSVDWSMSRWKLETLGGPELQVPLTCCSLHRAEDAHINPDPVNVTLCQSHSLLDRQLARQHQ